MLRSLLKAFATLLATVVVVVVVGSIIPGCTIGYVTQQARFQAELLAGRVPVERAIAEGMVTGPRLERLEEVARIKAFGRELGLSSTENYGTINPTWDRTIWNISACDPVAFRPRTWWFPVVGRVPYLGFFRREDADPWLARLERDGDDVYARTAGAYSTLGWFRDPILPQMLDWSEYQLANTVLHELAHATVWIRGSVAFNESFASFVGDEASIRYLVATWGADSDEVRTTRERIEDRERFVGLQRALYQELDAVYRDPALSRDEKLARKKAIFDSIETRTLALGLHDPDRYVRWLREGTWNNATLVQFRTYNRSPEWFRALLDANDGDLLAFMHAIDDVTRGADDPYRALARAVGRENEWEPDR